MRFSLVVVNFLPSFFYLFSQNKPLSFSIFHLWFFPSKFASSFNEKLACAGGTQQTDRARENSWEWGGKKSRREERKERKKRKKREKKKDTWQTTRNAHTHSALSRVSLQESPIPELTLSRHFFDFKCFFFLFSQQNRSSELGDFGEGFSEGRDQASPLVTLVSWKESTHQSLS